MLFKRRKKIGWKVKKDMGSNESGSKVFYPKTVAKKLLLGEKLLGGGVVALSKEDIWVSAPSLTTYIGRVVEVVVGEFDLVEEDVLAGPVGARGGGVRVDVEAGGGRQLGLRRADRHPLAAGELEPAVAGGGHLQHEEVARVRV